MIFVIFRDFARNFKLRYLSNHRSKRLAGKCVRKRWLHSFQKNSPHIIRPQSLWFLSTFEDDCLPVVFSTVLVLIKNNILPQIQQKMVVDEEGSSWNFFLKNTTLYLAKTVSIMFLRPMVTKIQLWVTDGAFSLTTKLHHTVGGLC